MSSTVQTQGPAYYEGIEYNPHGDAGGLEVAQPPVRHSPPPVHQLNHSPVQPLDHSPVQQQKYAPMNWAPPSSVPSGASYQTTQEAKPTTPATYHYPYQGSPPLPPPTIRDDKRICGLRRTTLILSILLAVVVIVAGVGGGIAGTTAVNNAKTACQSSRPSQTTTAGTGATPTPGSASCSTGSTVNGFVAPTDQTLALDCPNLNNTEQTITIKTANYKFLPYCGSDYNADNIDIVAVVTYSFQDCIRACASMNFNGGKNTCVAVAFNTDIKSYVPNNYGTCFLKSSTNKANVNGRNDKVTALLVQTS